MGSTDQQMRGDVDQETALTQLDRALIEHADQALRLTENHYLVCWQAFGALWCVIDMAALDGHAEDCSAFRVTHCCEHLDRISELCARERATSAALAPQQSRLAVGRTDMLAGADRVATVRR